MEKDEIMRGLENVAKGQNFSRGDKSMSVVSQALLFIMAQQTDINNKLDSLLGRKAVELKK